jgi:hypothetical protein
VLAAIKPPVIVAAAMFEAVIVPDATWVPVMPAVLDIWVVETVPLAI